MALVSRVFGFFAGAASGRSAGGVVDSVYELSRQNAWARRPYAVLDLGTAAEAQARDLEEAHEFRSFDGAGNVVQRSTSAASPVDFPDDAVRSGVGPARFEVLRQLARQVPPLAETLDLWRRKRIDEDTVNAVLARMAIPRGLRPALKSLRWVLPSVTDMVRFGVREVYNPPLRRELDLDAEFPEGFADDAETIGLDRRTAQNYWAAHWELPSFTEGAQMLFRGQINRAQFKDLLKALDYAPTWRGKLEAIARAIPTMQDFIRFAVREVYTPEIRRRFELDQDYPKVFTDKAALHGMSEEDAKAYWAAHWQLPSTEQGFRMFHRDVIDLPTLRLLLRAKDVMPFWRQKLIDIAYLTPGRIDLRRMYAAGVIDRARVKRGYLDLGYKPADAETLTDFAVKLAEGTTATTKKGLTVADLAAEYEGLLISRESFVSGLIELGYTTETAQSKADISEARRLRTQRNALINKARAQYVARKIDRGRADQALLDAGVDAGERVLMLTLWDATRDVNVLVLTPTQIRTAYSRAQMTLEQARDELIDRGYSAEDADVFLGLTRPRLSTSQILRALRNETIDEDTARAQLQELGYTLEQANELILSQRPELSVSQVLAAVRHHAISEAEGLVQLQTLGYSVEQAYELLAQNITELSAKQIIDAVEAKTITRDEGIQRLLAIGFRPEDAAILLPPSA